MGGAPSPAPLVPQSEVPINSGANLLFRSKEAIDFTDAISTNQSSLFLTKGPMILDIETSIIGIVDLTSAFLFLGPLQLFSFPKPF